MRSVRRLLVPVLLALVTAAIYLPNLQEAPAFLSNDEVCIALNARAIAATGRDVDGRFMPSLFYSPRFFAPNRARIWFLPMLVYATALVLKILPFTETAIRLPLVLAAIADVLLVYFIVRLIARRTSIAVVAAMLLALTPAHFFHARLALPAQVSEPFVLAWLLCVLVYLEQRTAWWLLASGVLLGIAAIGYVGPLVIVYGLLTWAVLYQRRARWPDYAAVVAGGVAPCLYFLWLARDPAVVQELLGHYQQPAAAAGFADVVSLYWNFWNPGFLFVEGAARNARAAGAIGVFLLPLAGLVALGVVEAVRRRDAVSILLLGGFFSAPLTASFIGEQHAIWRALEVAPFGVLLAALGLERLMSDEDSAISRWSVGLTVFAVSIAIAVAYRDQLQHGQAMIRMLLTPLAIALMALLVRRLQHTIVSGRSLLLAGIAIVIAQAAYVTRVADAVNIAVPILATASLLFTSGEGASPALLALLAGEFLYIHVDYPPVSRVGPIPASAILMAMRTATVVAALAVAAAVGAVVRRFLSRVVDGDSSLLAATALVVVLQLTYFHVGYFVGHVERLAFVSLILTGAIVASVMLAPIAGDRRTVTNVATVALLTAAVVQFGYFYVDYMTNYPMRNLVSSAGNVRLAWDRVIDDAGKRDLPAVFVGPIGAYDDAGLYWRFYLIKHHREDLLARTVESDSFDAAQVRRLPAGSVMVVSPSPAVDGLVSQLQAAGEIRRSEPDSLLRAPDGTPLFWILERD